MLFALGIALCPAPVFAAQAAQAIVIAHRGASGYLPEHTLEGYELAMDMGADYIEPDLVLTRDGVLIARHDHYLSTTTDVADHPEYEGRVRRVGSRLDWYSEDFTLAEIRRLRARQAYPGRSRDHDGRYGIPTFQEVIDLVKRKSTESGRSIGIYPETKVPGHFQALGFDFAGILLRILKDNDLNRKDSMVFIQSFEPGILRELKGKTELPLIQLVRPGRDDQGRFVPGKADIPLESVAGYANGVGAMKMLLIDRRGRPTRFLRRAHGLGLAVHVWTFRDDAYADTLFDSAEAELAFFLKQGIDGFFTDFPDSGVRIRNRR